MVFKVDKGIGMLQDNLLDSAVFGELFLHIVFSGPFMELSDVYLGEGLRVLVSFVYFVTAVASSSSPL